MTQIRETIEKLCVVFKYNGISEVTAETFRLAKFDSPDVAKEMWISLKNILIWLEIAKKSNHLQTRTQSSEESVAVVRFCKHEMFTKGYRVRSFFVLPENMSYGSREVLLAIGWLMAKENILQKFIEQVQSVITEDVPFLDSYCTGIAPPKYSDARKAGGKTLNELLAIVIQEVILLKGKLNSACRSLLAARHEYGKILQKIHAATLPFPPKQSPSSHLSTMDVFLLYNQKELDNYQERLEIENLYLHSLLILKEREALFWKWLESTVDIQSKQHEEDPGSDDSEKEECLVLNQEGYRPCQHTQNIKAKQVELSRQLQEKQNVYQNVSIKWKRYREVVEQSNEIQDQFQTLLTCLDQEVLDELGEVYNSIKTQIVSNTGQELIGTIHNSSQGVLQFLTPVTPQPKKRHKVTDSTTEPSVLLTYVQELQERDRLLKEELIQLKKEHNDRITKLALSMDDMVCIPPNTR